MARVILAPLCYFFLDIMDSAQRGFRPLFIRKPRATHIHYVGIYGFQYSSSPLLQHTCFHCRMGTVLSDVHLLFLSADCLINCNRLGGPMCRCDYPHQKEQRPWPLTFPALSVKNSLPFSTFNSVSVFPLGYLRCLFVKSSELAFGIGPLNAQRSSLDAPSCFQPHSGPC
jgi:hypothetical protein